MSLKVSALGADSMDRCQQKAAQGDVAHSRSKKARLRVPSVLATDRGDAAFATGVVHGNSSKKWPRRGKRRFLGVQRGTQCAGCYQDTMKVLPEGWER